VGRKPDALSKAVAYVRRQAALAQGLESVLLPGIRRLCRDAGVSQATMEKAVVVLKRAGLLRTAPGKGTYLMPRGPGSGGTEADPASGVAHAHQPVRQKWEIIAEKLRTQIASGHLGHRTPFPTTKDLAVTYLANHRTVRKSLQRLFDEGHLCLSGRQYAVVKPPAAARHARVVLITRVAHPVPFERFAPRSLELLRELQGLCLQRRVNLDYTFAYYTQTTLHLAPRIAETTSRREPGLLGFVLWTVGFSLPQVTQVLRDIQPLGLPVAVLDELGFAPAIDALGMRLVRVVTMANDSECGLDVGRYLLRLGHREIVYVDYEPMEPWSNTRLAGLRRAFEECGLRNNVTAASIGPEPRPTTEMQTFEPERLVPADVPAARRAEALRGIRRVEQAIWESIALERARPEMRRRLEQILAERRLTAWVGSGDHVARICLDFLNEQQVKVPDRISVVGFDDVPEAFFSGLTSYSFNPRQTVNCLLDITLTSPARLRREWRPGSITVPGFLVERRTTAAASALVARANR
jgi:DNA-binding LacI/PurR family transcriptional regulator/DNA-binding transcriptional regulator YhcF (GntR family)